MFKAGTNISQFDILTKLGEGAFGTVYKIQKKDTKKFYAMKKIKMQNLTQKEKQMALNEVRILASVSSPYIIKYKEAFYNDASSELCIVMEFADKGDLQGLINKKQQISEKLIWLYASQILQALRYLHEMNIIHRDLKGANIFLTEAGNAIKLGDLNVSKVAKSNAAKTQTGTPYYVAPEIWKGEQYNNKCDIWSLGCVLYELASLKPPFEAKSFSELYKKVLKGNYQKMPGSFSQELHKFVAKCLIISPSNRPSTQDLLGHPNISPLVIGQDINAQKQDLLKTLKLPYGGLHQLKNILPKAAYDDDMKNNSEVYKMEYEPYGPVSQTPKIKRSSSVKGLIKEEEIERYVKLPQIKQNQAELEKEKSRLDSANQQKRVARSSSQERTKNQPPLGGYNQQYGIYKAPSSAQQQSSQQQQGKPSIPGQGGKPPQSKPVGLPNGKKK